MGYGIFAGVAVMLIGVLYCLVRVNKQGNTHHQRMMLEKRKEIYQASMEHPALLVIENGRESMFADYTAVYGYPNYLFRSDTKQKWTTKEVGRNFCIWAANMEVEFFTNDYERRKNMERHLLTRFEELAEGGHITSRTFYKRVHFFNMWFVDTDFKVVNINMDTEAQALIMAVLRKMQECKQIMPLCAVVHQDEGVSHTHFLYCRNGKNKRAPDIQEILDDCVSEV